ncbi:hypothetical protein Cpar_0597 [Chlorobaculum parvum NCIB 8327]|uniref:Uncharacterized protein n=1 Tax=Chlorobaculum parvum (strain DSM 263 / NCIMB 8327) TaxID=517417 RepID=B3QM64_CHLP8|nr:hypothetical protein Cpar_0597 [Chlorobaculum parvum NCIB 8327]
MKGADRLREESLANLSMIVSFFSVIFLHSIAWSVSSVRQGDYIANYLLVVWHFYAPSLCRIRVNHGI